MDGVTDADRERDDVKERVGVTESDMVGEEDGDAVPPKSMALTWHVIAVRMTTKLSLCMIIGERQRSGIGVGRAQEFEKFEPSKRTVAVRTLWRIINFSEGDEVHQRSVASHSAIL
jgi:hypothetical protein